MPKVNHNPITYFAKTNFRIKGSTFGIYLKDRLNHFYIIGRTGTGKTTLLNTKIRQDILQNRGLCLIDIHGDLVSQIIKTMPYSRYKDVVYLDASNPNLELGYNPLRKVSYEKRSLITSNILEVFQKLWGTQGWGVKMAHILRNVILTLLDQPQTTFMDIIKILHDSNFRHQCMEHIVNPEVKLFWEKEFKNYGKTDLIPIYNKLGGILSYPSVKRILVENKKQISLRSIIDHKKILLVNLSKGAIGTEASYILGSLLLTSLSAAAFSRIDIPEHQRSYFFIYLDEFQNYTNLTLVEMLSELRKFKIGIIMAHQYISQLDVRIRDAVLNNVGTIITFRLGQADAKFMEKEFAPIFETADFVNLANYDIYLKLMIDGKPSVAFSATTLEPYQISSPLQNP